MQQFKYTAINLQKKKFSGKFIASESIIPARTSS